MTKNGRRAQAKDITRQALLEAGLAELVADGFTTPSLDAICARAGYTRGAFYVHFAGREEFHLAIMEYVIGSFLDLVVNSDERGDDLERTLLRFVEGLSTGALPAHAERAVDELLRASSRSPEVRARFLELNRELIGRVAKATLKGQEKRELRRDIEGTQLATLLVALALGTMMLRNAEVPIDLHELARTALRLLRPQSAQPERQQSSQR